jgi:copper chaperone CopZ
VVKRALEGLKGVQRADVSFHDKEARVMFEPTQVTVEQLIEAVNRSGFRASLKAERLNGLAGEGLFRYQPHGR